MKCRVGRVLRRLEARTLLRSEDLFLSGETGKLSPTKHAGELSHPSLTYYRPLTPEEVEDYKRRMGT